MIVVNAAKVVLTAGKADKKLAYRHSGYPGRPHAPRRYPSCWRSSPRRSCAARCGACCPRARWAARCSPSSRCTPGPTIPTPPRSPSRSRPSAPPGGLVTRSDQHAQAAHPVDRSPQGGGGPGPAPSRARARSPSTAGPSTTYFPSATHRMIVTEPLRLTEPPRAYDIDATIDGGGISGQAGALRLGIARALVELDPELRVPAQEGRLPHPRRPGEGDRRSTA